MIMRFKGMSPRIAETAFVADSADIIGDVEVGSHSSIWFNAVIRGGDQNKIKIGNRTSIQDGVIIHADPENGGVQVGGDNVSVGHGGAVLHGCKIEENVIIGMNSTVLNGGAEIGKNSIVGANALVPPQGKKFPPNSLIIGGVPGAVKRETNEEDIEAIQENAEEYVEMAEEYREEIKRYAFTKSSSMT